jgi:UDPglucose--hexose-1-phosphate uridylyltransferase
MRSKDKNRLIELSRKIFDRWDSFTDEEAGIFAFTDGEPHNAITPIARRRGEFFEVDLALRNNLTTEEFPLGVFHPHPEHHNIKKENIGLIEVMGLAILPARLKGEIELMKSAILSGTDFEAVPEIEKHKAWFEHFKSDHTFTEDNVEEILREEIGKTFVRVLEDASVFKNTSAGDAAYMRFIDYVNEI